MTLKNKSAICNNYHLFVNLVKSGRKTRGMGVITSAELCE